MEDVTVDRIVTHFETKIEQYKTDRSKLVTEAGKQSYTVAILATEEALLALKRLRVDEDVCLSTEVGRERQDVTCLGCGDKWTPGPFDVIPEGMVCNNCEEQCPRCLRVFPALRVTPIGPICTDCEMECDSLGMADEYVRNYYRDIEADRAMALAKDGGA